MSPCFTRGRSIGAVQGSLSDLLGLRLSLPRSRPAQISDGTLDSTEQLRPRKGNIATFPGHFASVLSLTLDRPLSFSVSRDMPLGRKQRNGLTSGAACIGMYWLTGHHPQTYTNLGPWDIEGGGVRTQCRTLRASAKRSPASIAGKHGPGRLLRSLPLPRNVHILRNRIAMRE